MQSLHKPILRSMFSDAEADSRARLRQDWEEISSTNRPTGAPRPGNSHGDANSWILELNNPQTRVQAMHNLCTHHRLIPDLGVLLWYSFGAVSSLIQEVLLAYFQTDLSGATAARVTNALTLLEAIAEHPRSKLPLACSKLHEFISPLAHQGPVKPLYESFRCGALRVLNALLDTTKSDRSFISEKEYGRIAVIMLADDSLTNIILTTVNHGQLQSRLMVLQILAEICKHGDILTIFAQHSSTRRTLCGALDQLDNIFSKEDTVLCSVVQKIKSQLQNFDRPRSVAAKYVPSMGHDISNCGISSNVRNGGFQQSSKAPNLMLSINRF